MKTMIRLFIAMSYSLTFSSSNAQQADSEINPVQFKLGAFYNSTLNYYGRTDSLRSSGFFPVGELWFSKNFYINAAPVFVTNTFTRFEYAGTVATAGFQSKSKNEKFLTHIYFTKPFYRSGSQLVQSALKEQLSGSFSWQNKFLNITIGADIKHSDKFDYGLTTGIDHAFRHQLPGQFILVLNPSAFIHAGTQQFTKTYYEKKDFLIFSGMEQAVDKQVNCLNVLSYELSMPAILAHGRWQLILIPSYVVPRNLVTVENRPDLSEQGKSIFYITAGAKVTF